MRKLVTIRKINNILNIANSDFIALAIIDGWQVIIKKTEFKVGDSCLFFEIDSFIPAEDKRFEFLQKTTKFNGFDGYRLRSIKLRGVISQGLALPLSMFPEIQDYSLDDYSEILKVVKYDNTVAERKGGLIAGNTEGKFPSFIPKTEQERIQNLTSYFETMENELFEETLKLDGSSMTCYKIPKITFLDKIKKFFGISTKGYKFGVCSRNLEIKRPNGGRKSDFWEATIKYKIEEKLPVGYAVQGELIGPKIQANYEKVHDLEYYVFDVFDIEKGKYLLPAKRREFCALHNIPHVPVIHTSLYPCNLTLEELLKHVEGESMNAGTISEGRVYKHVDKDISFKVISNKYLLKSER